jgi:ParB family chromosome partitioning protein
MFRDPAAVQPHSEPRLPPAQDRDAVEIGDLFCRGNQSIIDAARFHIECGKRLAAKKKELGHGSWLPWLKANANVLGFDDDRTARRLIAGWKSWRKRYQSDDAAYRALASDLNDRAQALQISRQIWDHNDIANGWVNSGNDEWFTETKYLQLARTVLGAIDLDPASHPVAQRRVRADTFFTKADDGLAHEWHGRVWLNPPFSRPLITRFTDKLLEEYAAGRTTAAVMLTNAYTSTKWFQKAGRAATAICFTNGRRLKFVDANGKTSNPTQGQAFFYFGHGQRRLQLFAQTFSDIGFIVGPATELADA